MVGSDSFDLLYVNMTVPNCNGTWPEELGGRLYPPVRAKLSLQFMAQLKADCPECPLLPDHEDGSQASAAALIPSESFLFAPPFLVTSWWNYGRLGLWDPGLLPTNASRPRGVMGHIHYLPPVCNSHAISAKVISSEVQVRC